MPWPPCSVQWRVRRAAHSSPVSSSSPDQNCSSADFSSRRCPMRGSRDCWRPSWASADRAPGMEQVGRGTGSRGGEGRRKWLAWSSPASGAPRPAAWFARRRQVSWLTGQRPGPAFPRPCGSVTRPGGGGGQRLAADSCGGSRRLAPGRDPAERTAFPFHPLRAGTVDGRTIG